MKYIYQKNINKFVITFLVILVLYGVIWVFFYRGFVQFLLTSQVPKTNKINIFADGLCQPFMNVFLMSGIKM